jgi:phasin family protein
MPHRTRKMLTAVFSIYKLVIVAMHHPTKKQEARCRVTRTSSLWNGQLPELDMATLQEQFSAFNEKALNSVLDFAALSFANTERLVDLQIESVKASLEETAEGFKALSSVRDPQELIAVRSKLVEASVERASSYARTVYELVAEAQADASQLVEAQVAAFNEGVISAVEQASASSPSAPGANVAIAAVKSSVAATTAAVDTLSRPAKQPAKPTIVRASQSTTTSTGKGSKGRK